MVGFWVRPAARGLQAATCVLVLCAGSLAGQTLTTGSIRGVVRGEAGAGLGGVSVMAVDAATGVSHSAMTAPGGVFVFSQLTPGEYDVVAERLGYRPKRVLNVPVQPLASTPVIVALAPAPPPVGAADVEPYGGAALATGGTRQWFGREQVNGYPDLRRELADVGRLSSLSDGALSMQGLPGWMADVVVDGIPGAAVRQPGVADERMRTAAFPLSGIEAAELVTNPADVEWPGSAAGLLAGYTLRGTDKLRVSGFGRWSGGPLGSSDPGAQAEGTPTDLQGAVVLAGPLAGDSAHILVGVEGRRVERPLGAAWAGAAASALQGAARDGLGVTLDPYLEPRKVSSEVISAFSRVDWQVTPVHAVELRASFATLPTSDPGFDVTRAGIGPLTTLKGSDVSVGATLRSELSAELTSELRIGVDRGTRERAAAPIAGIAQGAALPFVALASDRLAFGTDPTLPGSFTETTIHASETLQKTAGAQELKFGIDLAAPKYQETYRYGSAGEVFFGSVAGVGARDGVFMEPTGAAPTASFSVPRVSLFLQDHWAALPGLDLVGGVRVDRDRLPSSDITLNPAWDSLTAISNASLASGRTHVSPRASLTWDLGEQGRWILEAAGGLYYDRIDPAVLAQLLTDDGRTQIRRGIGVVDSWPTFTSVSGTTTLAPSLSVAGPKLDAPRTARGSASLTMVLGGGTRLRIGGIVRHTDYLPRSMDLNLVPAAIGQDQFGRALYGQLVQKGGVLAAQPGSNRRFSSFDIVSGISSDGSSDYRAVTISLEREASTRLSLLAGYTYSQSTDNWLGSGVFGEATAFPPLLGGTASGWADGTSDFDVPHRFVAGAQIRGPAGVRLAALYRYASGRPFTPGFGPGIDANGDGIAGNDPAFVSRDVSGASDLVGQWSCLAGQASAFAARNSCRGPAMQTLDARLAVKVFSLGASTAELRVEGLDLIHEGTDVPDPALYLVNPAGTLTSDASGRATVPLMANQHFGNPLGFSAPGATILLGIALNW